MAMNFTVKTLDLKLGLAHKILENMKCMTAVILIIKKMVS